MTLTFRVNLVLLRVVLLWLAAIATVNEQLTNLVCYLGVRKGGGEGGRERGKGREGGRAKEEGGKKGGREGEREGGGERRREGGARDEHIQV